jgi:Aspartyl protease
MTVPFIFDTVCRKAKESALLDSGTTENFMDQKMVSRLKLGTRQLPTPRKVHNVDGTKNQSSTITEYCSLRI